MTANRASTGGVRVAGPPTVLAGTPEAEGQLRAGRAPSVPKARNSRTRSSEATALRNIVLALIDSGSPDSAARIALDALREAAEEHRLAAEHEAAARKTLGEVSEQREVLARERTMAEHDRRLAKSDMDAAYEARREVRQLQDALTREHRNLAEARGRLKDLARLDAERVALREAQEASAVERRDLIRQISQLRATNERLQLTVEGMRAQAAAQAERETSVRRPRRTRPRRDAPVKDRGMDLKPDLALVRTEADLMDALRQFRTWTGSRSYQVIADEADMSKSTVHGIFKGDRLPGKLEVFSAIVVACGGADEDEEAFATAWRRLRMNGAKDTRRLTGLPSLAAGPESA